MGSSSPRGAIGGPSVALALAFGLACHGLFAAAIALALGEFWTGFQGGRGGLVGGAALAANAVLVLQFPLLHSFLLAAPGRRLLARVVPGPLGRDLAPTTFGIAASLQLGLALLLWSPSGVVVARAEGAGLALSGAAYAASWLLLVKALWDAGLGLQTGWIGWTAVLAGRRPRYPGFPRDGLFRLCRQPVYLAFALTLWTGPVLTLDRLALASVWSAYCLVGPLLKERRYRARFGEEYARWASGVPYVIPRARAGVLPRLRARSRPSAW